jgi:hypothetical protein
VFGRRLIVTIEPEFASEIMTFNISSVIPRWYIKNANEQNHQYLAVYVFNKVRTKYIGLKRYPEANHWSLVGHDRKRSMNMTF